MTGKQRRALTAQANRLEPALSVSADGITDAVIAHLRAVFAGRQVLKVRVHAPDREVFRAAAGELAARVPCELVNTIGRVVLLGKAPPDGDPAAAGGRDDAGDSGDD